MVIAARDIPRWVQPAPTTTTGDALVILTGNPDAQVAGSAPAAVTITTTFSVETPLTGEAEINYTDTLSLLPQLTATAEVVLDNTAEVEDHLGVAACIAIADITGTCVIDTQGQCPVVLLIFGKVDAAPVLSADAEVSFADYGQGSKPVFPLTFPTRFTDNLLDVQDAPADVFITGDGFDIQTIGYADATVQIATPGTLQIQGNTPIFPFAFPAVFTDAANNKVGNAVAAITAPSVIVLQLDGDAQAAIVAQGLQSNPAVFPLLLPVVFT